MSLATGVIAGSAGAALSNLVLAPLYAANQYIGSFYFGNGMILCEREMYQDQWPKIKLRLDKGESFVSILEEFVRKDTTAIMANARSIVLHMTPIWYDIVTNFIKNIPPNIIDAIKTLTVPVSGATSGTISGQIPSPQFAGNLQFEGMKAIADAIKTFATAGFVGGTGFGPAGGTPPPPPPINPEQGFIGPPQGPPAETPTLQIIIWQTKYKNMPLKQLNSELNAGIRGNMSNGEKKVILFFINKLKALIPPEPTPKTILELQLEKITSTPEGTVKHIAALFAQVVFELKGTFWKGNNATRKALAKRNFLKLAKNFNQFVQSHKHRNLTIDTAKSLIAKKIIRRF